ncbi:KxYKxGKxW signal peptide domain-containing protein, partial [Lactococcus lactis]|uniref:KxYKxGKxW signal peptide domain-containing protein n=2 Tax=Lactococcus lactis TaxID=1358 RepID=UPI0021A8EFF5
MSRKNNIKKMLNSDKHERYRSYKRKKTWMYATITGIASVLGGGSIAVPMIKADTTSTGDSQAKEVDSTSQLLVNQSKTIVPATTQNFTGSDSEASISITDSAYNPVNGWYTQVEGYWTYGIAALNNNNSQVLIILISKVDPSKVYYVMGSYNGATVNVNPGSVPTQVTSTDQPLVGGAAIRLNGTSGVYVTRPTNGKLFVKYRSASGGTSGSGDLGVNVNWTPLRPQEATVTVKYQDESGVSLKSDTIQHFYSQIQGYSVENIPSSINGLIYDSITSTGALTGRTTQTVILKYKVDANSLSDSTSDSISDSVSDSDSTSDSISDSVSDSDSTSD